MKINVDLLKDYRSDFSNEKANFNSSSYGTFSSGYINRCSDNYVIRMRDKLRKLYQNIEKAYKNIDGWWSDYNNDIESLERALSHDDRSGAIKASSVRGYIDSLPSLKNYSINFSGVINLNFEKAIPTFDTDSNNIIFTSSMDANTSKGTSLIDGFFAFLSDTGAAISEGWENSNFVHWLNDNVSPWLVDVNNNIYEVCENTMATIETGVISIGEGILGFGESIIDSLAVLSAASAEFQMNYDSNFQVIIDDNVGYFGEDTKYLWEQTQSFVIEEHVTTWFDNFYENSPHGQDLVNNAYFFDTVRQVGNGIGHTFGVVSFSAATFGVTGLGTLTGTMTTYAAFSGFGSGTEDAWKSGATIEEGVFTGIANASWEGFQWWIGGKIGSFDGKIGKFALINDNGKISSNILKSLFRIGADSLDGGVEGFVQPLISGIYQDGYYDENGNYIEFTENDNFWKRYAELFDDAGGLANVGIQTFIGAGGSLIGELFDLSKILRESSDVKVDVTNEYVAPLEIKGLDKFRNANEFLEAFIHGKTNVANSDYPMAFDYFFVRDRMDIEPNFGKSLENIFFDDDYVIGVHRLGTQGDADSIIRDGLNLTGHSSSGGATADIDLERNITFHKDYLSFLKALSEGSTYKRDGALYGYGDVVIIKIPKSEIDNLDSLIYYPESRPVLKPEYIQGKVSSFIDDNGKFHLTNDSNIMDLHIKAKELKELIEIKNSKEYLQYLDDINNGDAMVLNPDYDDIDIRIAELEKEIAMAKGVYKRELGVNNNNIDITEDLNITQPLDITESLRITQPLDITQTLDITQPLDAKVNILDNNQLSEEMRAKILDDFKKMMRKGKLSNNELLEMLMEMAGKKGDDGFRILQAITRIKSIIPELEFSANAYEDGAWWFYDDFECKLHLQECYIDWKDYGTLAHELGHCLFDMISGAPLPDNWDDMIVRAKINSSNNGTLKLFNQEYNNLASDIYWNQAYLKFEDSIMIQYGYTEKQYREFLTEQFKQASKMTDEDIIDIEKLVDDDIKRQISNFSEQIWMTQYGGYTALNDMIDAVFNGEWQDVHGGFGHGSKYYLYHPKNFPLHELIANFTSLKFNNEEVALKQFKEIFGTEFYDYLDSIYNSFLEFGKRNGGV